MERRLPPTFIRSGSVRAISSVIATLIIVALAIGIGASVTYIVLNQIGSSGNAPTRLQILDVESRILAGSSVEITFVIRNPTSTKLCVEVTGGTLFRNGFAQRIALRVVDAPTVCVNPSKLSKGSAVLSTSLTQYVGSGVAVIDVAVTDGSTTLYHDKLVVPITG